MLIDVHAHLSDTKYEGKGDEIAAFCAKNEPKIIIDSGADRASSENCYERSLRLSNVYCSVGVHPEYADKLTDDDLNRFAETYKSEKTVAIGEIGLDYHYETNPDRETQKKALIKQLKLAAELGAPVVLHIRDAHGDAIELLENNKSLLKNGFLLHCYSGSIELLARYEKLGAYFSYGGAVTFKNAKERPLVVKNTPIDKILLETDCPYMTPEPLRGRTNYPYYIEHTADKVAEFIGKTRKETEIITTANAVRLFTRIKI